MSRKSVQGGHCVYPDTVDCAFTKSDCDDPANFQSARQMQGAPVMAHGGSCRWQSSVKETLLGKCTTEDGVPTECASNLDACPNWDGEHLQTGWAPNDTRRGWVGPVDECTVENTKFGRCDYGMCAWSHEHCTEDNTWEAFDEGCTCDKVQVGACARTAENGEREFFCAVSVDGCDAEQSWVKPQEVMAAAGFDCFLCREESPVQESSTSVDLITDEANPLKTSVGSNSQTIVIIVATLGALLAVAIIGAVGWRVFRTKRAVKRAEEAKPPAHTIQISGPFPSDAESGKNGTDMDNASVLSEE